MQQLKRAGWIILLVVLVAAYHFIRRGNGRYDPSDRQYGYNSRQRGNDNQQRNYRSNPEEHEYNYPASAFADANEKLDRNPAHLYYTRHARCRMGCRHITGHEVGEILEKGTIDEHKSDPYAKPCPTYALEGHTEEQQHLRIVFAPCGDETRVITCIDLDHDYPCDCE